jgi:hypothetical protein
MCNEAKTPAQRRRATARTATSRASIASASTDQRSSYLASTSARSEPEPENLDRCVVPITVRCERQFAPEKRSATESAAIVDARRDG